MQESYDAIFCTTPYQILAAIALCEKNAKYTDIYITNQFKSAKEVSNKLEKEKYFHDVIYIDAQKLKLEVLPKSGIMRFVTIIFSLMEYLYNCLFLDIIIKKYFHIERKYKNIYVSSDAMAGRFATLYYVKHDIDFNFHRYDDGIGTYIDSKTYDKNRLYDEIIRNIIFGKKAVNIDFEKHLFLPELFCTLNGNNNKYKIHQIPYLKNDYKTKKMIKNIFITDEKYIYDEKFVVLDTVLDECFTKEGIKKYKELLELTENVLNRKNIIYKKHPREKNKEYLNYGVKIMHMTDIPFEVISYLNDCTNKVFITTYSTAAFMPKVLFNQEANIILLYGLLENHIKYKGKIKEYINSFEVLYANKCKIMMPNTKEEYIKNLKDLNSN